MKRKRTAAAILAACLALTMAGCGSGTAVYVQSVKALSAMGGIAPGDRFPGIVVSENVTEISKDSEKTIKELKVREGDDVAEGQFYETPVAWAVENGIVNGITETVLAPQGTATRAQIATIMMRMILG